VVNGGVASTQRSANEQPATQVSDVSGDAAAAVGALGDTDGVRRVEPVIAMKPARRLAERRSMVHAIRRQDARSDDPHPVGVEHPRLLFQAEADALLRRKRPRRPDLEEPDRLRAGVGCRHRVPEHLVHGEAERLTPAEAPLGQEDRAVARGRARAEPWLDFDLDLKACPVGDAEHQ